MLGPHFSLEFASKGLLLLAPEAVNNETAGSTGIGFDIRGFQGDLYIAVLLGALPATTDLTLLLQHADEDADGTVPEAGDFSTVTDSAGSNVTATYVPADADTLKLYRVNRERLKAFVRVTLDNSVATAAMAGVFGLILQPQYAEADSDRDVAVFFK